MEYNIIDKPTFTLIGKALRVSMKDGENFRTIPQFWNECAEDGIIENLAAAAAGDILSSRAVVGVCTDFSPDMSAFTYVIAAEKGVVPSIYELLEISVSAFSWAQFDAVGLLPTSIQSVWKRIWPEFFNVTDYKHAYGPELEIYPAGDQRSPDYRCEVWIPVTRK